MIRILFSKIEFGRAAGLALLFVLFSALFLYPVSPGVSQGVNLKVEKMAPKVVRPGEVIQLVLQITRVDSSTEMALHVSIKDFFDPRDLQNQLDHLPGPRQLGTVTTR